MAPLHISRLLLVGWHFAQTWCNEEDMLSHRTAEDKCGFQLGGKVTAAGPQGWFLRCLRTVQMIGWLESLECWLESARRVKVVNKQMQCREFVRGDAVLHSKCRMNYILTLKAGFFNQLKHFCLEMRSYCAGPCGLKCTDPLGLYIWRGTGEIWVVFGQSCLLGMKQTSGFKTGGGLEVSVLRYVRITAEGLGEIGVGGLQKLKVFHIKSVGTRGWTGSLFSTHTLSQHCFSDQ